MRASDRIAADRCGMKRPDDNHGRKWPVQKVATPKSTQRFLATSAGHPTSKKDITLIADTASLSQLRSDFRATSTASMPLAGMILWSVAAVGSILLPARTFGFAVACGSGLIFPLALLIDRVRGRHLMQRGRGNPVLANFMGGVVTIGLLWPLVIIAGLSNPGIIVLGAAILLALVWIPFGWSADDPVGMRHAIGRTLGAYSAYLFVPRPLRLTAICLVVVVAYIYSFANMRRD